MSKYPEYISEMLKQAQVRFTDRQYSPAEGAKLCFEVLALFPDCKQASELILKGFSQPELIRDYRRSISRLIDEWDDRPWQQRRRLALSFCYFSKWYNQDFDPDEFEKPNDKLTDVMGLLEQGNKQLAQAYFSGIERATEVAWAIFQYAIQIAQFPSVVTLWIANTYAHKGFFAEAMDVMQTAPSAFLKDDEARILWAEVRWWLDHQHQIPWIPPAGDGSLYLHYLEKYDPERLAFEKSAHVLSRQYRPPDLTKLPPNFVLPQPLPGSLEIQLEQILNKSPTVASEPSMDWSYLNDLVSGNVDIRKFPKWAQELLTEIDDPELRAEYAADFFARFSASDLLKDDEEHEED
ncbi:MAG: hypothetical protein Fur0022_40360 [Anaerolineales bacterium]